MIQLIYDEYSLEYILMQYGGAMQETHIYGYLDGECKKVFSVPNEGVLNYSRTSTDSNMNIENNKATLYIKSKTSTPCGDEDCLEHYTIDRYESNDYINFSHISSE